jgi:high-affinity K+ transport system ATPase subunit B
LDSRCDRITRVVTLIPTTIGAARGAIAKSGGTPPAVAKDGRLLGVVHLKDIVQGGIRERFAELRRMRIRTVMITGDNPMTAAAIAAKAGVDDFLAQATPEDKLKLIREEQAKLDGMAQAFVELEAQDEVRNLAHAECPAARPRGLQSQHPTLPDPAARRPAAAQPGRHRGRRLPHAAPARQGAVPARW